MPDSPRMPRRQFLGALAGVAGVITGCIGAESDTTAGAAGERASSGGASSAPAVQTNKSSSGKRPNILFILSDDHTCQAIGSYANATSIPTVGDRLGQIAPTSNIDRIGEEGARLNNCFCTNALCASSRASILTGQYSHEHGVYTLDDSFAPSHPNVAKELRQSGYRTALIGKWHLRAEPTGFDHWLRLPGQGRYVNPRLRAKGESEYFTYEGFSSDVLTEQSIRWMRQQTKREEPFCLMTHYKSCHEPFAYPNRNADLLEDTAIPEPPSLWEDKSHRCPGSKEYGLSIQTMAERLLRDSHGNWSPPAPLDEMSERQIKRHAHQRLVKRYLRSAASIDQGVGQLLDFLEASGLSENTVVIYASDQGYFLGEHNYIDKRWMYEESLRMPFFIRYPREIEPSTSVGDLALNVDVAPTLLDYAEVDTPEYMQGQSIRPQLRGEEAEHWRSSFYYRYYYHGNRPAHYGLRTSRYKLIFFHGLPLEYGDSDEPTKPGMELYDLKKDPNEIDNVYGDPAYDRVATRLKMELLRKKENLGDLGGEGLEMMSRRGEFYSPLEMSSGSLLDRSQSEPPTE